MNSYFVSIQRLENLDRLGEKVHDLIAGLVVAVTPRLERGHASAVLRPFMLPQLAGGAAQRRVQPVPVHVLEQVPLAVVLENFGDVGVLARGVAVGRVGTVAEVRPWTVQNCQSP
jgi:hypothetical protein